MAERKIRIIIFLHYEIFVLVKNYISLKAQLLEKKPTAVLIFYILFMLNLCFSVNQILLIQNFLTKNKNF